MNYTDTYMDTPFVCDEKTGDRCQKQCEGCKAIEQQRKETPDAYWRRVNQKLAEKERNG